MDPHSRRFSPRPLSVSIAALIAAAALPVLPSAHAVDFTWDANPTSPTIVPNDGSGTWNTLNNNWIAAGLNTPWVNDSTSVAIFGAGTDAATSYNIDVDLGGFGTASGLVFNNSGYVLSADEAQTIVVNSPSASITVATGKTATIGANVTVSTPTISQNSAVIGGGTLIIESGGTLLNSGTANTNVLAINGTTVEVRTGGSLLTTNPPQNAIFVNGTLKVVGGLVNAIGTLGIGQTSTGDGTVTITSGTVLATSTNGIRFGSNSGTTAGGTLNLDGGTLTALKLQKGTGTVTTSVVNFNGGTLQASSAASTAFLAGLGRANVRNGGAIIDSNSKSITIAQALEHSNIAGDAATDGGLTKNGLGTLTLTGANTYNGGTIINGGALRFDPGALPATGNITINSAGSLVAAGAFATVTELLATGRITTGSTGSVALAADSAEDINFSAYPTLRLGASVNSTYTGVLTPGGNTYRLGGGGAALKLVNANALTGARNLSVSGPGTVIVANTNDYTGTTTIDSGTLQLGDGITSGTLGTTSSVVNNGTLAFNPFDSQTFSTPISGTGGIAKSGTGTLILSGANTYSGPTSLTGGILQLANSSALGTSSISTNLGSAQLQLAGNITVPNQIRLQGSGLLTDGILKNVSGTNTLTDFGLSALGGTRINVVDGSTLRLPNSIALSPNSGAQNLRVIGTGTLSLGGDNSAALDSFSSFLLGLGGAAGPTIQIGNTLAFGSATIDFQPGTASTLRSADATAYTLANSLKFSDPGLNQVTFGAPASGDLTFSGTATLSGNLEANVQNSTTTLSGIITGPHELIKLGPGTLVFSGTSPNQYTGVTTVSAGLLTVQKDGGLGEGDVSLVAGGSLKLELGTTNNYISDTGRLLLSGTATPVMLAYSGTPDTIAALSFDGGNTFAAPGTWGSLTSGAQFTSAAFTGPGTLLVVPEPATAASLIGGLGMLLAMRRRRAV